MGRSRSPGPKPLQVYIYECIEISTVFKKRDHDSTFYQGSEIFTILAGMAEKICIGHQTGTENVLKCTGLNTGCFNWYQMFLFVQAISDGFCASSRYKKCSSNPVVSAFNFFVTALFFFSPFPRRQQLFVTVSSSFLSFSCSFYLFLSLFYPTLLFHCLVVPHVSKSKWKYTAAHYKVVDKSMNLCGLSTFQVENINFFFHSQISS